MTPVHVFAQYLLRQDVQRDPARSALLNYFVHLADPREAFGPRAIGKFYGYALNLDHWQREGAALGAVVRSSLDDFINKNNIQGDWSALRHPGVLQVVELKDRLDATSLIDRHRPPNPNHRVRTIWQEDGRALRLELSDAGLEVRVISPLALVWGTELVPVTPLTRLHYGPENELLPDVPQRLAGALSHVHAFRILSGQNADLIVGTTLSGPALHTVGALKGRLRDQPDLFMALKRLEKYFIRAQSDPDYRELVAQFERANASIAASESLDGKEFNLLLERGRRALNTIFPHDRLLTLLVTHLDYGISQRRHRFKTGGHEPASPTQ